MSTRDQKLFPDLNRPYLIEMILVSQLLVLWPLFSHLPNWIRWVCLGVISTRFILVRLHKGVPSKWLTSAMAVAGVIAIYLNFRTFGGRDAGVSLVTLMFCMKLLEIKTYRDASLVLYLAFFIMVANFLFSQSLLMAAYMLICMLVVMMSLQALHLKQGAAEPIKLAKQSVKSLLHALPIMLILFVAFPRLSQPLWRMPSTSTGATGIDDTMTPGDIGQLATFDEVAFRVDFEGDVPPQKDLYWRGLILSEFNGLSWTQADPRVRVDNRVRLKGERYAYRLSLEPTARNWLFVLEMPESLSIPARVSNEQTYIRRFPIRSRLVYEGVSYTQSQFDLTISNQDKEFNTQLPDDGNPRARRWANQHFLDVNQDPEAYIDRVLRTINQGNYVYTLDPGVLAEDTIDDFWLNQQKGYCEHYASAFAFLMRSVGIPARVVIGYQGGEMNPYSDYMLVRQNRAHAWAEVWLEGQGWKRFDPTAAIHPSRVEVDLSQGWAQREQLFGDQVAEVWREFDPDTLERIQLYWDAVNNAWQNFVIDYNAESQFNFFDALGLHNMSFKDYLRFLVIATIVTMILISWWLLRAVPRTDKVTQSYQKLLKKCRSLGYQKAPSEGTVDFIERIIAEKPELKTKLLPILELYISLRFREQQSSERTLNLFAKRVNKLKLN